MFGRFPPRPFFVALLGFSQKFSIKERKKKKGGNPQKFFLSWAPWGKIPTPLFFSLLFFFFLEGFVSKDLHEYYILPKLGFGGPPILNIGGLRGGGSKGG